MAEFTLPKNSKVGEGKRHPAPSGATNVKTFRVYRWSPDDDKNPEVDSFEIDMEAALNKVLKKYESRALSDSIGSRKNG